MRFPSILTLLAIALSACSSTPTQEPDSGIRVRLQNSTGAQINALRVTTGPDTELPQRSLAPGASTDYVSVAVLHTNPLVSAEVGGRTYVSHPVEGFVPGFNAPLAAGSYTIVLGLHEQEILTVIVKPDSVSF